MSNKMEYNLQKLIEPSFYTPQQNHLQGLTPYPSKDFINPGIGSTIKLYSIYQPIHAPAPLHSIDKKIDLALMQEGSGDNKEDESNQNE
jgi:hypothetical protein